MNTYTVAAVGLVLSAGLVAGCGSSGGEEPAAKPKAGGPATGSAGAARPGDAAVKGPRYDGPAVPGLAAEPAWSLPSPAEPIDLGDTFLFAKDAQGAYASGGGSDKGPVDGTVGALSVGGASAPTTLEFRDVRTGEVRKTLTVKADRVVATTWHQGVRAVAVLTGATTESDGLSAEKTSTTVTVYGGDGAELGRITREGDTFDVHEGYVVEQDGEAGLKLTAIDGGAVRKVVCTGLMASCGFDPRNKDIDGGPGHAPLITGPYTFHVENASTYQEDPAQLVMTEPAGGKKVWSTADVTPPPGVELDEDGKRASSHIRVLDVRDGKVLTAWGAGVIATDTWVTATYDIATGKQVGGSSKYTYADSPYDTVNTEGSSVFSLDRTLAAVHTERGTAVWRPADGKEVRAQAEGEKAMEPLRFAPDGVLYGIVDGENGAEDAYLAVDGRTKKVLAKSLPEESIPLFSRSSGYGYLSTGKGFFVFPAAQG
ncbi:hypothetical protein [Streptomyces lichenis]|uniref:PQQ-binding-like beta-propeller repeat protein n=1 Tax=Streptomyces lichenis TaxID=2306967 RepID=A0ABT0I741_9ACTN|nr:hypothetical protein [Streptomyces lichenis]MCK8677133.1 hypothetical protein [Streptomyces lichenis]